MAITISIALIAYSVRAEMSTARIVAYEGAGRDPTC